MRTVLHFVDYLGSAAFTKEGIYRLSSQLASKSLSPRAWSRLCLLMIIDVVELPVDYLDTNVLVHTSALYVTWYKVVTRTHSVLLYK